jgi:hypothetical protein
LVFYFEAVRTKVSRVLLIWIADFLWRAKLGMNPNWQPCIKWSVDVNFEILDSCSSLTS